MSLLRYPRWILFTLLLVALSGCEFPKEDEMTFTEAVKEVYTPCNRDDIKLNTAAKGLQLVFEPCGSNNFFHYGWAPTGTSLHYQTTQGLWVLKDTGENYPLRVGIPSGDSAWINDDMLAYPDANGRQIGVYTVATHVLYLLEIDHSDPEQLAHGKGVDEVLYLASDVPGGVKDVYRLKVNSGSVDKAFPWLNGGVDSFTYQRNTDSLCYRALDATEVICARAEDGKVLRRVKNRKRGVLSVDGRYLVTEGDGAPVANFPDLKPDHEIPNYLDMETIPPALWITDMQTGEELLWKGLHGTDFEWYEATPYFGSFVLWGLDNGELNSNITLVDLRHFLESKGWTPPLARDGKPVNAQLKGRSGRLD